MVVAPQATSKSSTSVMDHFLSLPWVRTYNLWAPVEILLGITRVLVSETESELEKPVMAVPFPNPGSVSIKYSIRATGPELTELAGNMKKVRDSVWLKPVLFFPLIYKV